MDKLLPLLFCVRFLASVVTVVTGHLHFDFGTADVDPGGLDVSDGGAANTTGHHLVSPFNFGTISAFLPASAGQAI